MDLQALIAQVPAKILRNGNETEVNPEITSLAYDSRQVTQGSLFFAIQGEVTDGHLYIDQALQRGAVAVASEKTPPEGFPRVWLQFEAVRPAMAHLAHHFFGRPSEQLKLIGITGTNGKTTTAFLIHSVLQIGAPALLMGTIKTLVGDQELESRHTTPEAIDIQRVLRQALDNGCKYGVMEVSSHALALYRAYQCRFPVSVFTNLTQDHLDFHGTLEEYFQAKLLLFDRTYNPGIEYALVNADDGFSERISFGSKVAYGLQAGCDVYPLEYHASLAGTEMKLVFLGRKLSLRSTLVGRHNLYNLMAAAAACSLAGIGDDQIQEGISRMKQVPGRFEKVDIDTPFSVVVDYAHTPDALANVLGLARELTPGRVICVFGCGGDRDRRKRPIMGAISSSKADLVIVTSDNPRSEDPQAIIDEILTGMPPEADRREVIVDRREAIKRAIELAKPGDTVLIAGKGHETYQIFRGQKSHFDDREVVKELV
ncbi:MAG TPA: UDP-N-acetylmuramoyl-L-alanyl-D-glutamate--2,6-diaminopimelate ligase [Acidobacteriota bacterium]|nr:UDP-N-acetylmuramoyl-L-alanyl-D-glutamate--2,6-diaminopimelate ligase [Acidobacteriota bacterium]